MSYISKQFAGPIITSVTTSIEDNLKVYNDTLKYFDELSIKTAKEKHLELIGKLIGFPRPFIPNSLLNMNIMRYTDGKAFSEDNGFSSLDIAIGVFGSVWESSDDYFPMPLEDYRRLLLTFVGAQRADLPVLGNSLLYLSLIVDQFSKDYEVKFMPFNDIEVTVYDLNTFKTGIMYILLQSILNTAPIVTVVRGSR